MHRNVRPSPSFSSSRAEGGPGRQGAPRLRAGVRAGFDAGVTIPLPLTLNNPHDAEIETNLFLP
jgi:hypothetical protein